MTPATTGSQARRQPPLVRLRRLVAGPGSDRAAAVAATTSAAALGWAAVFPNWGFAAALAGAACLSVMSATVLAHTRLPAIARAGAQVAAGMAYAAAVAQRSGPTPAALAAVARGLRDGWAQLLDATLPAPTTGGAMVTAVAIVWVAGVAAAAARRAGRAGLSLVPPLVALCAGLAFGAGGAVPALVPAGLVAAAAAVLLPRRGPGRVEVGRRLGAVGVVAAVATVVALTGSGWPGAEARDPYDPRRLRDQTVRVTRPPNPLTALGAAVSDDTDPVVFRARVTGAVAPWRLVVLDHFDGRRWTATGTFRRVGAGLPEPGPERPVTRVSQQVRLVGLTGPFLPAYATPVAVDVEGAAADGDVLVLPDGVARPRAYRVTSAVPSYDGARIEASAPVPAERLPEMDAAVRDRLLGAAAEATAGANPSGAGTLQAMAVWFSRRFALATGDEGPVPTGNGLFHIGRLLDDRTGTAEQFASAFAVLARLKGYQARVVVGYRPGRRDRDTGELVVRAHHAHAWPEVRFDGIGWVAFEPTPTSPEIAAEAADLADSGSDPVGGVAPGQPATAAISPTAPGSGTGGGAGNDKSGAGGTGRRGAAPILLFVVAAGVALVSLAFAVVLLAKQARQRRQAAGGPAERVAGAWSASLDRLAEAGVRIPVHLAAAEVAAAQAMLPAVSGALSSLAVAANAARFSGEAVADADADAAWVAAAALAGALREGRSLPARARLALSPTPLRRRAGSG